MRKLITPLALLATLALAISFANAQAKPGADAPAFSLTDTNGQTQSLADAKGKIVVLEWINPTCPYVQRHYNLKTMSNLASANSDVVWMAIATGKTADADALKKFASEHSISNPILLDKDGAVAKAYGAKATPHMFVIDKDGKLAYAGAIDSAPSDDPSAPMKDGTTNYVEKAIKEIKAGSSVSTPETQEYGCGVKY